MTELRRQTSPPAQGIPAWVIFVLACLLTGVAGLWLSSRAHRNIEAQPQPAPGQAGDPELAPVALPPDLPGAGTSRKQPPNSIDEFRPEPPAALRARMTVDVEIAVKVYVDTAGSVIRAVPLHQGIPVVDELGEFAAEAALKWRFEPARTGGAKVPGQTVVRFRFTAGTKAGGDARRGP